MNKKETLNTISDISTLAALVIDLCIQSGLTDVKKIDENVIRAVEKGPFKDKVHKYIVTLSELNGKVPQIADIVKRNCAESDEIIIVTNQAKISDYFKKWMIGEIRSNKIDFWNQSVLIATIDAHLPSYWGHNDLFLKSYEDQFLNNIENEIELNKVLKLDKKFDELLKVFINPKIFVRKEDKETGRPIKVKIALDRLLRKFNFLISGEAGTGKSTLLKQIGKLIIEKNHEKGDKFLPIFIKPIDLQDSDFKVELAIERILNRLRVDDVEKIFRDYHLVLLIDSIDEFEPSNKEKILDELKNLCDESSLNFILGTRNYQSIVKNFDVCDHEHAELSNFDQRQVRAYLDNFFKTDLAKSNTLWENLQENNILERIPVTPLTISLVSILFEERQYEIPATITDVYDNFNIFLLGRLSVKSKLEFLDINVKERILSSYALMIISSPNRERKSKGDFLKFVTDFFQTKSITINNEVVPELLRSLTEGTGILYFDEKGKVAFTHDHFMEYYASREIFIQRDRLKLEQELIEKFVEYNWQNTAIFYAGRTKDMPEFLQQLTEKVKTYTQLDHCLLGVSGLGYVLQALWMTNSEIRKGAVIAALDLLLFADSRVKELAVDKFNFFKGIRDIDVAILNLFWFFRHFNSIVIKDPLKLAFEDLHEKLSTNSETVFGKDRVAILFQLFCIASTLNTGRNGDSGKLSQLFEEDEILQHPLFVLLFDVGLNMLESSNAGRLKQEFGLKEKLKRYVDGIKFYLDKPSEELRFTTYDQLNPIKMVELLTEGKTDASLLSHAFSVLTEFREPAWNVTSMDKVNKLGGGARELHNHLISLSKTIISNEDKKKIVIGIFDNDAKGHQEFNGMDKSIFKEVDKCTKKHETLNIYAIKIPIPPLPEFEAYHQEKQEFKFFEIEHYFPLDLLSREKMIKETSIPGVYEILSRKAHFVSEIVKIKDPNDFRNFCYLFRAIDQITGDRFNYIE